jgi:hypothetical protein
MTIDDMMRPYTAWRRRMAGRVDPATVAAIRQAQAVLDPDEDLDRAAAEAVALLLDEDEALIASVRKLVVSHAAKAEAWDEMGAQAVEDIDQARATVYRLEGELERLRSAARRVTLSPWLQHMVEVRALVAELERPA